MSERRQFVQFGQNKSLLLLLPHKGICRRHRELGVEFGAAADDDRISRSIKTKKR